VNIQRGEIIRVNLNPTTGREQSGNARPCLVLSHTKYNNIRHGIVVVMPITSTLKPDIKMMIPIPEGYKIKGSVITEQIRTLDLSKRWWITTEEILPSDFVDSVVKTFALIIASS
jgi:mRNA-degrading endonuclease toxin of MazEF toxin-antitoxin module